MKRAKIIRKTIGKLNPPGTLILSKEAGFLRTVYYVFLDKMEMNVDLLL